MDSSNKTIVWFRRDLRIEDNPALISAARDGCIFPVYIWCPKEEGQFYPGRVSRWWLKQSLAHLDQSLKSLGAGLVLIKTESTFDALLECVNATGATKVVFNHLYDPVSLVRDHNVKQKLVELGISVQSYNSDLLFEPWETYDEKGNAYTNFESYWNKCLNMPIEPASLLPPWKFLPAAAAAVLKKVCNSIFDKFCFSPCEILQKSKINDGKHGNLMNNFVALLTGKIEKCSIDELNLENESEKSSNALLGRAWSPGWSNADKVLTEFIEVHLVNYSKNRLKVGGNSTSLLSPYLHFGELSVRKVFQLARTKQILWVKEGNSLAEESVTLFLRAIGLREYSRYLCFNFPFTHERSLLNNLKFFPWKANQAHFKAWRQGRTGYPLVDAGMRELWATGWIHNRIRVIVSSFSVKVLLLPWRWGMKYFWDTLLDADLESDILGWQYISGSLPDGHELERLDSPEVQGSKFDPEGEYVRQWLPELVRLPTEWIHHPWDAPEAVLKASGVELGFNYPKPIVDLDSAREHLTEAIIKMWEMAAASKAGNSNGKDEVVVDNLDRIENLPVKKVALKEKKAFPCPTSSSNDQRVPTSQNLKTNPINNRKRSNYVEEEERDMPDNTRNIASSGTSRTDKELCSTAESSSAKKQTTSRNSFSVPQSCSLTKGKSSQECEFSKLMWSQQGQTDIEQSSTKDGT